MNPVPFIKNPLIRLEGKIKITSRHGEAEKIEIRSRLHPLLFFFCQTEIDTKYMIEKRSTYQQPILILIL